MKILEIIFILANFIMGLGIFFGLPGSWFNALAFVLMVVGRHYRIKWEKVNDAG